MPITHASLAQHDEHDLLNKPSRAKAHQILGK
jgi:hypothetical protein